jgi:hypothetical protein
VPRGYGGGTTIQTWDASSRLTVLASSPDEAQQRFEDWLHTKPEGESPVEVTIRKISAAQFVDQLFTESGNAPLDWPKILKQAESQLESTAVDDFEQGYWVDVDQVVRPEKLSFSVGTLQSDVPEDIRSGLNWSGDRNFLFLVSVLTPIEAQAFPDEPETGDADPGESEDEDSEKANPIGLGELFNNFPEALDKEAAAVILARNSVVAAWLWRRYAANTRLAANAIRIDPWCGAIGVP